MGIPLMQMARVGAYVLRQRLAGVKRYPLVLMLEPLFRCNLACAGCGKIDYPDKILNQRISVAAFNHASTYVADVVWRGQSTRHIRQGIESEITLETLRQSWLAVSPMSYFDQFSRWPRKSLIIYAKYDLTFLPELSQAVVKEFERYGLEHKVVILPCGHYTMGEAPYSYMDGWHLASFLRTAFNG